MNNDAIYRVYDQGKPITVYVTEEQATQIAALFLRFFVAVEIRKESSDSND